jgi:hypothetical protein
MFNIKSFLKYVLSKITVFRTAPKQPEKKYQGRCPECGAMFSATHSTEPNIEEFGVCDICKLPVHLIFDPKNERFKTEKWEHYIIKRDRKRVNS